MGSVEQAAVIGGQANGGIPLVNGLAKTLQIAPVAAKLGGENTVGVFAAFYVIASLAQAIVIVARILHGQQAAILRIEDKEKAVKQGEGRLTHLGQGGWRGQGLASAFGRCGQGLGQSGKHLVKHHIREVGGHPFFITATLAQNELMQTLAVPIWHKRLGTQQHHKQLEPMAVLTAQDCR